MPTNTSRPGMDQKTGVKEEKGSEKEPKKSSESHEATEKSSSGSNANKKEGQR